MNAKRNESISRRLTRIILVLIPLSVIYIGMSILGTYYFRMKIMNYAETFVDYYIDEIDTTIANINRRMGGIILGEREVNFYINQIKTTRNVAFRHFYLRNIRETLQTYSMEYGNEYHFFAFFPVDDTFVCTGLEDGLDQKESAICNDSIRKGLKTGELDSNAGGSYWRYIPGEGNCSYLIKLYYLNDAFIGCWIRPDDLIAPLKGVVKKGENSVLLYDAEENLITGKSVSADRDTIIEKKFTNLPFHVRLIVHDYGFFQTAIVIQSILLGMSLVMMLVISISTYNLYGKVTKSIKKFLTNLDRLNKGITKAEDISVNELAELERANTEFRQLLKRINSLQNEVYESEIRKQSVYMEYLKVQIEPHFYLNCLNFIYNMIDLGKEDEAGRMALMTAEYMRYLFNKERDVVTVKEEINHIRHYLEIQKLRFEAALDYYIECEVETEDAQIPPLIIQTFIENCIKYAMDLDSRLSLTVTVFSEIDNEKPYLNICITDNGPGFSEEMLSRLAQKKKYMENETRHIGISNAMKRLFYTYGEKAKISFYNGPVKGAVIDIHIPHIVSR